MAAINDVSYPYGGSNLDAAAAAEVVVLDGGAVRTLQVLVPNGTLRPIDPDDGTTIPIASVRGPANEVLTEYPATDAIGEWHFCLIGYPSCSLGVTGPESGAVEKVYEHVPSAQAITQVIAQGLAESSTFDGSVDWNTQVDNKPAIPSTAAEVGAVSTSAVGAANGVAPLVSSLVPIANIPIGTSSTTVAAGDHTHPGGYAAMAAGEDIRITETAPGTYPPPPTSRSDIIRVFRGSIRPTPTQGWRDGDEWINGSFV